MNGVLTGVREASHERIGLADDDVRYNPPTLRRTIELLGQADLVRPQNYFDELPWHARWDTGRSLFNRVFTGDLAFPVGDFPGTLAVRRSTVLACGGYDGDVLFENLELMRTVRAAGGVVVTPLDLYVARKPPTAEHFLTQRVRQAYDDFAMPLRLFAFLAAGPAVAALLGHRSWRSAGAGAPSAFRRALRCLPRSGLRSEPSAPGWRSANGWLAASAMGTAALKRRPRRSAVCVAAMPRRTLSPAGAPAPRRYPPGSRPSCECHHRTGGSVNAHSGRARPPAG